MESFREISPTVSKIDFGGGSKALNFIALELFGSATIDSNPVNYVSLMPIYVSMSFQKLFSGDQW